MASSGGTSRRAALVTGAAGFCGRHLAAHLLAAGYRTAGLDMAQTSIPSVTAYQCDLADTESLEGIVASLQPDVVFHLAALTNPHLPYELLHRANVLGTLSLLTAVRRSCPAALVLVTVSSAVYGHVPAQLMPIGERQLFRPASLYAVSKIAQEMLAYQQSIEHGLRLIRTRTFNLTGPGESPDFVTSAFARQIAEIEAGRREAVLRTGNLDTVRDLLDVRDAVQAYRLLAERGEPGEVYNVCSGRGTSIRQLLKTLLGLSRVRPIAVETDPARLQPADVPVQIGESLSLRMTTSWSPKLPLEQTLHDVLDYWREQIQKEP